MVVVCLRRARKELMSAVLKLNNEPSPGDLWTWTKEAARGLPARSGLLLWTLVSYYNRSTGRCDPGLRELAMQTRIDTADLAKARDDLKTRGLIDFDLGSGTRATHYRFPAFDAWHGARSAQRRSVRTVPTPVPHQRPEATGIAFEEGGRSVRTVPTKPSEPSKPKAAGVDLKVVPATGWRALVARADADYRHRWLDSVVLDAEQPDGTILLSITNPAVAARLRTDLRDPQVLGELAAAVDVDPDRVKIKAPKVGHDPHAERRIRNGDPDGYDPRRSAGRRLQQWEQRMCERIDNDDPIDTPVRPSATVIDLGHFRAQQEDSRAP
jgi:hypothetical protein